MFPDMKETEEIETEAPRFQIFKTNMANNIDMDSPMGISVLANSIDRYKSIDMKYDSFYREFKLGKKRILVDPTAMKASMQSDENGNVRNVQYFDVNDEAYVGVNGMENQPVKDIDFSLRTQEHIDSINMDLNWLSSNLGFGNNFYKFENGGLRTATEIISENADAFRTKVHYDIIVNNVSPRFSSGQGLNRRLSGHLLMG
jgi:A118 family predicted phage portal protein